MEMDLEQAVRVLKQGGVVVFPTETTYGIAADATNSFAIQRVMKIKGRELWKTPPLIVATQEMAEVYVELSSALRIYTEKYWPGPLTVVGKAKTGVLAREVIREDETIALRVSSHPIARELSRRLGFPIVATSANRSGKPECYSVKDVQSQFASDTTKPDFYLDGGAINPELPSTIIQDDQGTIRVIRQGSIHI